MVRDRFWLILACVVLTAAVALVYSLQQTKEYEAVSKVLLTGVDVSEAVVEEGASAVIDDPEVRTATDLDLASLPSVAERVVRNLNLGYGPETVLGKVDAEATGNSRVLTLSVTDAIPRRAAAIADSFAEQYVAFRRDAARERYTDALDLVEARLQQARGQGVIDETTGAIDERAQDRVRRLEDQVDELELLASLQTGEAEVIQEATVPTDPVRPKTTRNVILGALLGLLLGLALALLRDRLDRRLKEEDQLRALAPDVPIVGWLPSSSRAQDAVLAEAFRTFQTNLSFLDYDGTLQSVLVTSPAMGEGKSTTTLNLALAMAERDERVLLMDADLRRASLSAVLGLQGKLGVSSFLSGQSSKLEDYLTEVAVRRSLGNGTAPTVALSGTLSMVPAGPVPPNPQALLSARSLDRLLAQARTSADRVVIDGAPLGPFSDMLPVARRVDGVLIVVRLYHSRRNEVARLLEQLEQVAIRPLGIVVVGSEPADSEYYTRP